MVYSGSQVPSADLWYFQSAFTNGIVLFRNVRSIRSNILISSLIGSFPTVRVHIGSRGWGQQHNDADWTREKHHGDLANLEGELGGTRPDLLVAVFQMVQ